MATTIYDINGNPITPGAGQSVNTLAGTTNIYNANGTSAGQAFNSPEEAAYWKQRSAPSDSPAVIGGGNTAPTPPIQTPAITGGMIGVSPLHTSPTDSTAPVSTLSAQNGMVNGTLQTTGSNLTNVLNQGSTAIAQPTVGAPYIQNTPSVYGSPGVATPMIAGTTLGPAGVRTVAPNETVQGQYQQLMASDNPLIQQAQTAALQQMNARGMINSSMAIGASQDAAARAALPIASADAQAYQSAANQSYAAQEQARLAQFQAEVGRATGQAQMQGQTSEFNAANTLDAQKTNAELQFRTSAANLDSATKNDLANIEAQYRTTMQASASATDTYTKTLAMITSVMQDPHMSAQGKHDSIATLVNNLQTGLGVVGAVNGLDFNGLLDFTGGNTSNLEAVR